MGLELRNNFGGSSIDYYENARNQDANNLNNKNIDIGFQNEDFVEKILQKRKS